MSGVKVGKVDIQFYRRVQALMDRRGAINETVAIAMQAAQHQIMATNNEIKQTFAEALAVMVDSGQLKEIDEARFDYMMKDEGDGETVTVYRMLKGQQGNFPTPGRPQ